MGHTCGLCMGVNSDKCPNNPDSYWNTEEEEAPRHFYAFDLWERRDIAVTAQAWLCLPPDEDEAEERGLRYCRQIEW